MKIFIFPFLLITTLAISGCTVENPTKNIHTHVETISKSNEMLIKPVDIQPFLNQPTIPIPFEKLTDNIHFELFQSRKPISNMNLEDQLFTDSYTDVKGVLTFRGNHYRNSASFGVVLATNETLAVDWSFQTGHSERWGGGAGWTGQPGIIQWDEKLKAVMNLYEEFKKKPDFVEVVQAALDGRIYFLDLDTGKETRPSINIGNPIKGTVSLDPRGYPLLYVGQGILQKGEIGFRIFSLIDGKLLHFQNGVDGIAYRKWGAFDGAALINKENDTLFIGGENGILYKLLLNTKFSMEEKAISIDPIVTQYRYRIDGNNYQGIENSIAAYQNLLFFADNGGSIQSIDMTNMQPRWALPMTDDTDATIVVENEKEIPFLYTGSEVDIPKKNGVALIRKINGLTGEIVWEQTFPAYFFDGVNGGVLASPVLGKEEMNDLVIFTVARTHTINGGTMYALDKTTGEVIWTWEMANYAWSSPVDVYTKEGKFLSSSS